MVWRCSSKEVKQTTQLSKQFRKSLFFFFKISEVEAEPKKQANHFKKGFFSPFLFPLTRSVFYLNWGISFKRSDDSGRKARRRIHIWGQVSGRITCARCRRRPCLSQTTRWLAPPLSVPRLPLLPLPLLVI